jgi:UDP-glucose 6-dehydrogenase
MQMFKLQSNKLFWFLKKKEAVLDSSKDRHLIIHQTLALGSMQDVEKLFQKYGRDIINQEFQKPVKGIYSPAVFNFFEYILGVQIKNSEQYIKNIYGKTSLRNS